MAHRERLLSRGAIVVALDRENRLDAVHRIAGEWRLAQISELKEFARAVASAGRLGFSQALGEARSRPVRPGTGRSQAGGRGLRKPKHKRLIRRRAALAPRSGVPAVARCRIICRESRSSSSATARRNNACHRRGPLTAARRDPAQYQVIVTRRPKYACRRCQEAVVQAPAPARLIEAACRPSKWSPMWWSRNMPITALSIAKP